MKWKDAKRDGKIEDRRGTVGAQGNRMLRKIDKSGLNLNERQTEDPARQSVSQAVQTNAIVKELQDRARSKNSDLPMRGRKP